MLKSCPYCGRIHERNYICPKKPVRTKKEYATDESKFRSKNAWTKKAKEIKRRDGFLCQVCIRGLYEPRKKYEVEHLEVHHIVSLKNDFNLRLCNENLITLCEKHHEMAERGNIPSQLLAEIAQEQEEKQK